MACVRVDGQRFTAKKGRQRNANVGQWPAPPVSYRLLARTHPCKQLFFLKKELKETDDEEQNLHRKSCVDFSLIYIEH